MSHEVSRVSEKQRELLHQHLVGGKRHRKKRALPERTIEGRQQRELADEGLNRLKGVPGMTRKRLLRTPSLCTLDVDHHVAVAERI